MEHSQERWSPQPEQMTGREFLELPRNRRNRCYFHSSKLGTWKILETVDNTRPQTAVLMECVTEVYVKEKFPRSLNLAALLPVIFIRLGSNSCNRFPVNVHWFNEIPVGISKCFYLMWLYLSNQVTILFIVKPGRYNSYFFEFSIAMPHIFHSKKAQ